MRVQTKMNERIRELVRESNLDMYGLGKERHRWEYTVEKFAELIVRECVGICNDTNDASYLNGVIAGRKIKQHFGVEE